MRLIDVDKIPGAFLIAAIAEAPTVDAVPVIRCKDCNYRNEYRYCTLFLNWHYLTGDMDYCSMAERKEE